MKNILIALCVVTLAVIASTTVYAQTESGLISCWKLDEGSGTTALDAIGFNDGRIDGASWIEGIAGNALSFDGIDNAITVTDADNLQIRHMISLAAWIYPTQKKSQVIIRKGSGVGSSASPYALSTSETGDIVFSLRLNYKFTQLRVEGYALNEWSYVVGTYDGTVMKLYVNGQLENSAQATGMLNEDRFPPPLLIGTRSHSAADTFKGIIDEIALYEKALTLEEIQQKYQNSLQGWGCGDGPMQIDIKPGKEPNKINLRRNKRIRVAVLTSDSFDATLIDPLTVAFGPEGALEVQKKRRIKDIDKDGDLDLVLYFRTQEAGILCTDKEAGLTGETFDGQVVESYDAIKIVKCPKNK